MANSHKSTNRLPAIFGSFAKKYLSLLTDLAMGERPIESLQHERDALLTSLHSIYSGAPATTSKAYLKAQEALKTKEDLTFSEDEIDAFLPRELNARRNLESCRWR